MAMRSVNLPVLIGAGAGARAFAMQLEDASSAHRAIALTIPDALRILDHVTRTDHSDIVCAPLPEDSARAVRGLINVWLPRPASVQNGLLAELLTYSSPPAPRPRAPLPGTRHAPTPLAPPLGCERSELLSIILEEVGSLAGRGDITPTTPLMDVGLDSMLAIQFAGNLESRTGVSTTDTHL